jgi:hypothetical protein
MSVAISLQLNHVSGSLNEKIKERRKIITNYMGNTGDEDNKKLHRYYKINPD